ncbi:hypothetical protein NKH77_11200 [Streptomyces sp. M19]
MRGQRGAARALVRVVGAVLLGGAYGMAVVSGLLEVQHIAAPARWPG